MNKIDDFKRQFAAIISNCELTQLEFEENMIELTYEIAHQYFLSADIDSLEEGFWSVLEDMLKYAKGVIKPK